MAQRYLGVDAGRSAEGASLCGVLETAPTVLGVLLRPVLPEPRRDLDEVWEAYRAARETDRSPFGAAVGVASEVDRLALAFGVGYPAALEHLVPEIDFPSALCVTEANGNAPRAIQTSLVRGGSGYALCGTKSFVTFGDRARALLVVARIGDKPDGRPDLVVVRIPGDREGIELRELPQTPFVPEVPHRSVRFDGVTVHEEERLPGDGYLDYVKPFRTVEDIHVVGTVLGYLLGLARRVGVATTWLAELAADLAALDRLRLAPPLDPRVHIALHGVYRRLRALTNAEAFAALLRDAPEDERKRWERDHALLEVASKAREARFERAAAELA